MFTRRIRIQLVLFAAITVVVLAGTAVSYVHLPQLLGFEQFTVKADFSNASGLYANAQVTERGVDVGKVERLDLRPDGVDVVMRINNGRHISGDARAEIHSTSAIGEQYVDLVPPTAHGPYLHDNSVIPRVRTVEMPQAGPLLTSVDALLRSVPNARLTAVLGDLSTAFGGSGPALQRLLDSSSTLLRAASANIAPTRGLLNALGPVLTTQEQLAGQTSTYVTDLASFTDQLVQSDADIRRLLDEGPAFAGQVTGVESDLAPTLPVLLANLTSVGQVLETYLPGVQQLLVIYPALAASLQAALPHSPTDNEGNLDFKLNILDPPPCITGFIPASSRRDPGDLSTTSTPTGIYCKVAPSDPRSLRGSRNTPCLNNPGHRAATPELCLGSAAATTASASGAGVAAVPYEPTTGRFLAPNGQFYLLGDNASADRKGPRTWQDLLLRTISK